MSDKRRKRTPLLAVFDTEGTTIAEPGAEPFAVLYFWDFLVLDASTTDVTPSTVTDVCTHVSGRDVGSLYRRLNAMIAEAEGSDFYWCVGVHNFSYDCAYLRKWLVGLDDAGLDLTVTAKSSTKIIALTISRGKTRLLTFFDTLSIFGCSLRTLGDNLGFPKLHLDYDKSRTPETPLSDDELDYNHRDTEVLMTAVCQSLLTRESVTLEDLGTSVLTKTSIVRKADREAPTIGALTLSHYMRKGKRKDKVHHASNTVYGVDRSIVARHQFKTEDDMRRWASYGSTMTSDVKGFFAGGVNVSNANHIGQIMTDVVAYDLKSAYPAIMLSYRIPDKPRRVPSDRLDEFAHLLARTTPDPVDVLQLNCGFWYGTVRLHNVRMDEAWRSHVGDSTVTQSMVLQNAKASRRLQFEDGYLVAADELVLSVSTPEFYEVCLQYGWASAEFEDLTVYDGKCRPTYYSILRTCHHYQEKCVAKAVSKAVKRGGAVDATQIDEWVHAGYMTYDEGEALKSGAVDEAWAEAFTMAHKGNLNSLYGIQVTDPLKDSYTLGASGYLEDDGGGGFEAYQESSTNGLMWREAGVCIALFNRYKIAYMAALQVDAGAEVLYIDTDSIKSVGLSKSELDALYKPLHARIEDVTSALVSDCFADVNVHLDAMEARTHKQVRRPVMPTGQDFRDLGKLDYEGTYAKFVTMGHKKYAYDEGAGWRVKCSGYSLRVLGDFMRQLEADGLGDLAPILVLGYDVRYDSSTGIATIQSGVEDTWRTVRFEDADGRVYEGVTCPGYAILDSGKIMNNTENSAMNCQRFEAACRNSPAVREVSGIDVRRDGGAFTYGRRGYVTMDWQAWGIDYRGAEAL